ncbi:MAG: hypothetical protein OJF50_003344 [Nitrospira sp.]|jgi:mercuric ion transport protein|nr:hypothetical protein [Nitrospira sp.]
MNQESSSGEKAMDLRSGNGTLIAGVLTAVGVSVCCVAPLVLLALGISGAWISTLTALEPLRPVFIGLTLLFLGLSFRKVYLNPQACAPGIPCADSHTVKRAYSDPSRPLIPTPVGHPFRRNAATDCEVNPATHSSSLGIGGRHPSE